MAQLDRVPSNNSSAGVDLFDDAWEDDEDAINDVESLRSGIIKTSKYKANAPYTILLVGETGVGKSSIFELIANVLAGNAIDNCNLDILDHTNERGGSNNQSQTNAARFYELRSKNGIVVRILDTPGLADTRGIEQDELHKESIAAQIEQHVDTLTAILVLANATVPRVSVVTNYALSTLSAIFPKHLTNNIAFLFTNVGPLHWNFFARTVPSVLEDAPQFLLNNPIALHKQYLRLQNTSHIEKDLRGEVLAGEQKALETLVDLFDWLDGLQPLPKAEFLPLRGDPQDRLSPKDRREAQNTTNSASALERPPVLPSPTLRRVIPNYGPISGGVEIALIGDGFIGTQGLLVRFGVGNVFVGTVFDTQHTLICTLPRSDFAGEVSVTLHRQDRSEIQIDNDVKFRYEGAGNDLDERLYALLWDQRLKRIEDDESTNEPTTFSPYASLASMSTLSEYPPTIRTRP